MRTAVAPVRAGQPTLTPALPWTFGRERQFGELAHPPQLLSEGVPAGTDVTGLVRYQGKTLLTLEGGSPQPGQLQEEPSRPLAEQSLFIGDYLIQPAGFGIGYLNALGAEREWFTATAVGTAGACQTYLFPTGVTLSGQTATAAGTAGACQTYLFPTGVTLSGQTATAAGTAGAWERAFAKRCEFPTGATLSGQAVRTADDGSLRHDFASAFRVDPECAVDQLVELVKMWPNGGLEAARVFLPYLVRASYAQQNLFLDAVLRTSTPEDVLRRRSASLRAALARPYLKLRPRCWRTLVSGRGRPWRALLAARIPDAAISSGHWGLFPRRMRRRRSRP